MIGHRGRQLIACAEEIDHLTEQARAGLALARAVLLTDGTSAFPSKGDFQHLVDLARAYLKLAGMKA